MAAKTDYSTIINAALELEPSHCQVVKFLGGEQDCFDNTKATHLLLRTS